MKQVEVKKVSIHEIEIHPSILEIVPLKIWMALYQDLVSINTVKILLNGIFIVSKKKGMRKNSKYLISRDILFYIACLKMKALGEECFLNVCITEPYDGEATGEVILFELMSLKRDQLANAVVATILRKIEIDQHINRKSPLMISTPKDTTHKRSHTLRLVSGFDGRSLRNYQKSIQTPDVIKRFIEELI